nr:craniofacial development protein 1 [Pelodiscus sinensis]|eukprot:XP_006113907.1 craniofacial development protein 1 [Pelodiscus sinensis]
MVEYTPSEICKQHWEHYLQDEPVSMHITISLVVAPRRVSVSHAQPGVVFVFLLFLCDCGSPCCVIAGGEYSEDDVSELVKEDEDEEKPQKEKGKKSSKAPVCRKRKRGGILLVPRGGEELQDQRSDSEEEADSLRQVKGGRAEEEEEKKKKEDALWASFLSDVGQNSKAPAATQVPGPQANKTAEVKNSSRFQEDMKEPEKPKDVAKVTITKVFDFAGEEVRVTKEVDAASKEAKSFLKQQEKETQPVTPASLPTVSGVKRPSGMSSLLGKLGSKKQKMSTLEKSKLDWENFKEEEGIGEEQDIHNRGQDGYVDRKAFLERVDHRQFEIERDIRMSKMKP